MCAGTAISLLCPTMNKWSNLNRIAQIHNTDSLWPVNLMSTGTQHINMILVHIDRNMSISLYCIGMENNVMLFSNLTDLLDRLNGTNLIVCKHNRDHDRCRSNSCFQLIQLDHSILIYSNVSHLKTILFQIFTCMQNRMMLYRRSNNMISFFFLRKSCRFQRPVIRLTSTTCKINLISIGTQKVSHCLSGILYSLLTLTCETIYTGWIAIFLRKIRHHCLQHLRMYLRCCRIIQINQFAHVYLFLSMIS